MRLIDADALKAVIEEEAEGLETLAFQLAVTACINHIEEAPTVDAVPMDVYMDLHNHFVDWEPIKHGRWKHSEYAGIDYYQCSLCGHSVSPGANNYCPNCGAKMDLPEVPYYERKIETTARETHGEEQQQMFLCRLESGRLFYTCWKPSGVSFRAWVMTHEWIEADDGVLYRSSMIESITRIKE